MQDGKHPMNIYREMSEISFVWQRQQQMRIPDLQINIESLEKVQPVDIEASDIDVRIGTTWIEPTDYEEFIYDLLNTKEGKSNQKSVV